MAYLWKVTAKRRNGKVSEGMNAEILITNTASKPTSKHIAEALSEKYNTDIGAGNCSVTNFIIEKLS